MAFSGRARRPGAFSAQKEALTDAPFAGEWLDEDGEQVVIRDSKIHASDGGVMDLTVKSKTQVSFKMDGDTYDGTLSVDGGKIIWSDGAAWLRKGAKPGGEAAGAADAAEEQRRAEAARKAAEEEEMRKRAEAEALDARRKAEEAARKKAQDAELAKKAAALEKAKAAKAAAEAAAAAKAEEAAAAAAPAGSGVEEEKARSEAGIDKARQAFEAEKARKAAALERAKAAKAAQDAAAQGAAGGGGDEAGIAAAKAQSEQGIDKARAAFEAEKARKAAALEKARAAKAAADAAAAQAADPQVAEAKAKSQAGLDKARAAFEAEKARKQAALEKARAAKAAAEQEAAEAKAAAPAPASKELDAAKAKSEAGLNKARAAFEAEKARKAAALEKARAAKAAQEAAEKEAQEQPKGKEFEAAKAKSTAGLDKARAAFEAEKARKAAALERARAKAAEEAAAREAGGGKDDDEDDEPPSLTTASGAKRGSAFSSALGQKDGGSKRSAFSSALNESQPAPTHTVFTGPPKGKTMSAFATPGSPQELAPPDVGAPEPEVVTEVVQLSEADFEPGIVVRLQNLKTKPELNGQWGVLVEFSEEKKRWSVRIDGMEDMALRAENLQAVSQEEYDAWMAEQVNADANAKYEMEAMLKSRVCGGKTRWTDSDTGKITQQPGENGNMFDICMAVEPDGQRAARKIADVMKDKGVCLVEANAPPDLLYQAYEEAEKAFKAGEFHPPMQDFGASELEMSIWHQVLFQDESKVKWVSEDQAEKFQALCLLGNNLRDFATGLKEFVGQKLQLHFSNLWDSMLVCYSGDRNYSFHLDNPSMPDVNSLPDNGLRLTLAYFINPHWSPEDGYNGGGLDVYLTDPSGPPESLTKARKANRLRIAPHADTLAVFASQRMAHQVIATKGKELWFCLWMWCFDEEVMERFPAAVHQRWQEQNGQAPRPKGSDEEGGEGEEDEEDEVIED